MFQLPMMVFKVTDRVTTDVDGGLVRFVEVYSILGDLIGLALIAEEMFHATE